MLHFTGCIQLKTLHQRKY